MECAALTGGRDGDGDGVGAGRGDVGGVIEPLAGGDPADVVAARRRGFDVHAVGAERAAAVTRRRVVIGEALAPEIVVDGLNRARNSRGGSGIWTRYRRWSDRRWGHRLGDDGGVRHGRARRGVRVRRRAEHDLIDRHAVLARLYAQGVQSARDERHGRRLRQPVGAVHPAPAGERAAVAALQVDDEPAGRPDPEKAAATRVHGIRKLRVDRVVELRVTARFQTEPDVIRRIRGRGEREIERVRRRRERVRHGRPSVVGARDRVAAGGADVGAYRPVSAQIGGVGRVQHDVWRRCGSRGARRQQRDHQREARRIPGQRRAVQHETPEVSENSRAIIQTEVFVSGVAGILVVTGKTNAGTTEGFTPEIFDPDRASSRSFRFTTYAGK